jgi:hypothetical protein
VAKGAQAFVVALARNECAAIPRLRTRIRRQICEERCDITHRLGCAQLLERNDAVHLGLGAIAFREVDQLFDQVEAHLTGERWGHWTRAAVSLLPVTGAAQLTIEPGAMMLVRRGGKRLLDESDSALGLRGSGARD